MTEPERSDVEELRQALAVVDAAAVGDSNDFEIEALRHALWAALRRWPEIDEQELGE